MKFMYLEIPDIHCRAKVLACSCALMCMDPDFPILSNNVQNRC